MGTVSMSSLLWHNNSTIFRVLLQRFPKWIVGTPLCLSVTSTVWVSVTAADRQAHFIIFTIRVCSNCSTNSNIQTSPMLDIYIRGCHCGLFYTILFWGNALTRKHLLCSEGHFLYCLYWALHTALADFVKMTLINIRNIVVLLKNRPADYTLINGKDELNVTAWTQR
jgi:hypothetical protein